MVIKKGQFKCDGGHGGARRDVNRTVMVFRLRVTVETVAVIVREKIEISLLFATRCIIQLNEMLMLNYDYRNSPTIKFCADLFPTPRCPSAIKFKIRLECASVN